MDKFGLFVTSTKFPDMEPVLLTNRYTDKELKEQLVTEALRYSQLGYSSELNTEKGTLQVKHNIKDEERFYFIAPIDTQGKRI